MTHTFKQHILLAIAVLLAAACAPTAGSPATSPATSPAAAKHGDLSISGAWSRAATKGSTGVIYLTITNNGAQSERLMGVQTDVTTAAELHESKEAGGMMSMSPVSGGIVIPAGAAVELKPGGYHVMLMDLNRNLEAGARLTVTLQFERNSPATIEAEVRER
jgi:copper(I)-binding protein